ncbi:MAG: hypothetical protein AAFR87_22295 [Bacteroidota bacterium]
MAYLREGRGDWIFGGRGELKNKEQGAEILEGKALFVSGLGKDAGWGKKY